MPRRLAPAVTVLFVVAFGVAFVVGEALRADGIENEFLVGVGEAHADKAKGKRGKKKRSGWRGVPFTGTVTVKRMATYKGKGDIKDSQVKVHIEETMVVHITGSKKLKSASGKLYDYQALGTFDVSCSGSYEMTSEDIDSKASWQVTETKTPHKDDAVWVSLDVHPGKKQFKMTLPRARAKGGTKTMSARYGEQTMSGSGKASCSFDAVTKEGVGTIKGLSYDPKQSHITGATTYNTKTAMPNIGLARKVPVVYTISWSLSYGAGAYDPPPPPALEPPPPPKKPEGDSLEYSHNAKWKRGRARYEMKVHGYVPIKYKGEKIVDHWQHKSQAYEPLGVFKVSGNGQVPFTMKAKAGKCDLIITGAIEVSVTGKEWPRHRASRREDGGVSHLSVQTLNLALAEKWSFKGGEMRCPGADPRKLPKIPPQLVAHGKRMPGAVGSKRTLEFMADPVAGKILRSKALPGKFKGEGTFTWQLHSERDGSYSSSFGKGSTGKGVHHEGSVDDPDYELPRPDLKTEATWGPPLDKVPDCGPGSCGSRPCCL